MEAKKDIILIIGGGGMSGIFSAGVLKAFEDPAIFGRVHSVYAVSVGGCNAARFVTKDSELGGWGFYNIFNSEKFLKGHLVRYFFQVLRHQIFGHGAIDDIFDLDYFADVMLRSEIKIDMQCVISSGIPFFVKVFNVSKGTHHYLPVTEPNAFTKVLASASATPLISKRFILEGEEFFDGDTIPSDMDIRIAEENPDKLIIRLSNRKESLFGVLNFFNLFVIYTLLRAMHGPRIAGMYFKEFFKKPLLEYRLRQRKNVMVIENNDIPVSLFSKDAALLKRAYQAGLAKGEAFRHTLALKN